MGMAMVMRGPEEPLGFIDNGQEEPLGFIDNGQALHGLGDCREGGFGSSEG